MNRTVFVVIMTLLLYVSLIVHCNFVLIASASHQNY